MPFPVPCLLAKQTIGKGKQAKKQAFFPMGNGKEKAKLVKKRRRQE